MYPTVVGHVMTVSEEGMCTHSSWSCCESLRQGCVATVVGHVMIVSEEGMCSHSSWSCYDSL